MAKNNQIYIKPVGGLCNRMRAVDSCISLANKLGKQVTVFWGRDPYLNCKFSDLFQPSHSFKVIEESQVLGKKSLFPYLPGSRPTSPIKQGLYTITKSVLAIEKEIWFEDLDLALLPLRASIEPGHIKDMRDYEEKAIAQLTPYVSAIEQANNTFLCSAWRLWPDQNYKQRFVPTKHLRHKIAEVTSQFDHTIGLHIRRGDHKLSTQHSGLLLFKEAVQSELDKNSKSTFFLATDCLQAEQDLKDSFPDKIITFKKQSYDRNTKDAIQDAVVDLFCLSETDRILGSYFSSFSQIAAEISGSQLQTLVYEPL